MNRVALLILSTLVLAACGGTGRPQADQDRDGSMLASALRGAWVHGSTFKMDQRVVLTGGGSNSGQSYDIHSTVDGGTLRDDTARFAYRKDDTAQLSATRQGHQSQTFDMLVADGRVFVRKHGQSEWKAATLPSASSLFPVLRLDLLRESVLLARSVSPGGFTHVDAGFARRYAVQPSADQLEQLESLQLQGQEEEQFLKTATGEIDVFLLYPDNQLARVELRLRGTDPQTQTRQEVTGSIDLRPARVGAISAPADSRPVTPDQLLA